MDLLDFKNVRVWAEWDARMKCKQRNGHMEVTLQDIWENLAEDTGLDAMEGMQLECEIEEKLCYANPYMLQVWKRLQELEKRMIIVSDMYLPRSCIERILQKAGYTGAERIYISNEYGENKAGGALFHRVLRDFSGNRIVHIGDNPHSDHKMAQKCGLAIMPYQNVNKNVLLYRPMDMSSMIGGAYRGLVSNHLYNGTENSAWNTSMDMCTAGCLLWGTAILFMRITSSIIWIKYCFSRGMEIFFAGFIRSYIRMTEPYMFTGPARLLQN